MRVANLVLISLAALVVAGCNTTESVKFQALSTSQQPMMRDGRPSIVSKKTKSVVLVSPASRGIRSGTRPVYVVGISNVSKAPIDFRVADVAVNQIVNGSPNPHESPHFPLDS